MVQETETINDQAPAAVEAATEVNPIQGSKCDRHRRTNNQLPLDLAQPRLHRQDDQQNQPNQPIDLSTSLIDCRRRTASDGATTRLFRTGSSSAGSKRTLPIEYKSSRSDGRSIISSTGPTALSMSHHPQKQDLDDQHRKSPMPSITSNSIVKVSTEPVGACCQQLYNELSYTRDQLEWQRQECDHLRRANEELRQLLLNLTGPVAANGALTTNGAPATTNGTPATTNGYYKQPGRRRSSEQQSQKPAIAKVRRSPPMASTPAPPKLRPYGFSMRGRRPFRSPSVDTGANTTPTAPHRRQSLPLLPTITDQESMMGTDDDSQYNLTNPAELVLVQLNDESNIDMPSTENDHKESLLLSSAMDSNHGTDDGEAGHSVMPREQSLMVVSNNFRGRGRSSKRPGPHAAKCPVCLQTFSFVTNYYRHCRMVHQIKGKTPKPLKIV